MKDYISRIAAMTVSLGAFILGVPVQLYMFGNIKMVLATITEQPIIAVAYFLLYLFVSLAILLVQLAMMSKFISEMHDTTEKMLEEIGIFGIK